MKKMHPKIWSCFLAPRFIKNTANSYSCIRRTPSFDVQFWGKKVSLIHETAQYVCKRENRERERGERERQRERERQTDRQTDRDIALRSGHRCAHAIAIANQV